MLFDYHSWQNAKRAGSVHATYLVYGTTRSDKIQDDGDVEMASSAPEPEQEPLSEEVQTLTLALVQEDRLEGASRYIELFKTQLMLSSRDSLTVRGSDFYPHVQPRPPLGEGIAIIRCLPDPLTCLTRHVRTYNSSRMLQIKPGTIPRVMITSSPI